MFDSELGPDYSLQMLKNSHLELSRRESQIMDALFRLGTASVADVLSALDDPPAYNSIRTTLGILEKKGLVTHHKEGARFIYRTRESAARTGPGVLKNLVRTFFGGSAPKAVAALLDESAHLSDSEYRELRAALDKARRRDGEGS